VANQPAAAKGLPSAFPCRPTRAYIRIIGAPEGATLVRLGQSHVSHRIVRGYEAATEQ
jgi:hypothetical protein